MSFYLHVRPGAIGCNIHVQTLELNETLLEVLAVEVVLSRPANDASPLELSMREIGAAHYFSPDVEVSVSGEWRFDLRAYRADGGVVDVMTIVDL